MSGNPRGFPDIELRGFPDIELLHCIMSRRRMLKMNLALPPRERRKGSREETSANFPLHDERVKDPEQHVLTLRHYEKELTAALLKNAPRSLRTLTEKAHGSELLSGEVKIQLESLDPSVPHGLMCRYLLLHAHKSIKSRDQFMRWLELLSTVDVAGKVLSLVRQHYESLVNTSKEVRYEKGFVFKEFEVSTLTEMLAGQSSKWEVIAISLGLPDNKIKNIAAKNVSKPVEISLNEVLLSWVRGEFEHAKPPTLENLQEALRSEIVGLGALANNLRVADNHSLLYSEIEDDISGIIDQSKQVVVTEGNYALLEVQCSGDHKTYQWSRGERILCIGEERILCIFAKDITSEGYYQCRVKCDEATTDTGLPGSLPGLLNDGVLTEPILVTVHTPIDQYHSILVDSYTRSPEIPKDSWPPPVLKNSYINLALIKQDNIHKAGKYGRCTIRGDMDDILKDKEGITYDNALGGLSSGACLLIEGRPGSGKTTLAHKFSQDWARKEITLEHVRLLFLVHLRGFCSDPNIGLHEIIGCYFNGSGVEDIEKYANKHQGLGLCFVLDGLDEYIPQRRNAYIYELIRKRVLPKSVVIVASRPAAAADFRSDATMQIEVLGFLKDQIHDYIGKYPFSSHSKSHEVLHGYLDEHPNVLHMCYLPIHTCMVCFLYDDTFESDLPQTETSIYAEFTKSTMLRTLYRDDNNLDMCIESLSDLPEPHKQLFVTICKLAFEMTSSSKQVLRQTDVKDFFNLRSDKDCMGLITVDKMATRSGNQKLYTFLHLTFQEFLAAFYIFSLGEENQLVLIEKFGDATHMKQVWKFYYGIVGSVDTFTLSKLVKISHLLQHGTLFKAQCSFESQQPCTCDGVVDSNSLMFKDLFITSSDFTAIAYVISNTQHQCVRKIVLNRCTIGKEGVDILANKTCGKLSLVTTLCYHGYDCVTEQLSVVNRLMHLLPSLEILDVSNTNIGHAEVDALTVSLNCPNLQIVKVGSYGNPLYSSLDLPLLLAENFSSGCSKLVNVCFSGNSRACMLESLYFYCNFPHLNMSFCKLRLIEFQVLSDDLICSHNCTELYLTGCGIDDNTVTILANGLRYCTHLETLDLSYNRIGDKGAVSLAESVKSCQKLDKVNLAFNRIGDIGAMAVVTETMCPVYLCGNDLQHVSGHNVNVHTVTFSGCNIGDDGSLSKFQCELSTKPLQCYSCVNVFDISSNKINNCHRAVVLSSCLKYFTHLEELNVSHNYIGADGVYVLAKSFCHFAQSLCKLDISYNSIESTGASAVADALNHCTHLEELTVSHNNIKKDGACVLAGSFCHYAQSLRKLDISNNDIKNTGASAVANALNHCTHLEELTVSHNNIKKDGARVLARSFCHYGQSLRKLDISNNNIGSTGASAVADALNHCTHLEELTVSHNELKMDGARVLARSFCHYAQSLRKLDISNNSIGSTCASAVADALNHCTHLEELTVSHNELKMDGARVLASSFCHYAQSLRKLDISNNTIDTYAIASELQHCVNLRELYMSYNEINAHSFAVALKHCTNLCILDISHNYIGRNEVDAIAEALNHCTHLEVLNIGFNDIRDDGACSLSSSFSQHLHTLDISYNYIGSEGCKAIAKALPQCVNLKELDLSGNRLKDDGAIVLARALTHCNSLRILDIRYNKICGGCCRDIDHLLGPNTDIRTTR